MSVKVENVENVDVLSRTQLVIETALKKMGYADSLYELLKEPLRLLTVRIPLKMDDGSVKVLGVLPASLSLGAIVWVNM